MTKIKSNRAERLKFWRSVIKGFKNSEMKQAEYARKHNLQAKYISKYYNKFKREDANESTDFISIEPDFIISKNLKLNFANGSSLDIPNNSNLEYLEKIIKLLQE